MATVGFVATTGAARAAASPYVNYQWPTVCDTYSVPTISNPTWQQQLIGVPTAPVKYMYTEEPSIVTNYPGAVRLQWSAGLFYQSTNGSWYGVSGTYMTASATIFQRSGSALQSILWNGQYPPEYFPDVVPAGRPARALATLEWLNSAGQIIASSVHCVPNYSC
jgi:hypothetical protein